MAANTQAKQITEEEWRKRLTPEQYAVLRGKGTEAPFMGALLHQKGSGRYECAGCGAELFSSDSKFDSGTGWPSFDDATENVGKRQDYSHGMVRTEVYCKRCGGHLGHLFDDGPTRTGKRFCINSCAIAFAKKS